MTQVILFIFGTIIGSFLNVVGLRYNSGRSLSGRSACPYCSKKLKPRHLIPILSFLWQKGRCAFCRGKISPQYPLVELWTGLLFVTLFSKPLVDGYVSKIVLGESLILLVFCVYTVIAIYDLRHKIIPDLLSYTAVILALFSRLLIGGDIFDFLAGLILFGVFALLWFLTGGRAMGFGDAKLSLSIGLLGGAAAAFSGIILAFWIGALVGVGLIAFRRVFPLLRRGKNITMKSEIPFAPFMILGLWLAIILKLDLLHVSLF